MEDCLATDQTHKKAHFKLFGNREGSPGVSQTAQRSRDGAEGRRLSLGGSTGPSAAPSRVPPQLPKGPIIAGGGTPARLPWRVAAAPPLRERDLLTGSFPFCCISSLTGKACGQCARAGQLPSKTALQGQAPWRKQSGGGSRVPKGPFPSIRASSGRGIPRDPSLGCSAAFRASKPAGWRHRFQAVELAETGRLLQLQLEGALQDRCAGSCGPG